MTKTLTLTLTLTLNTTSEAGNEALSEAVLEALSGFRKLPISMVVDEDEDEHEVFVSAWAGLNEDGFQAVEAVLTT